ncbi:alpha/beta hydrolase fold domain-containing protein [Streptomyces sp. A1-5]|uniref:alpha/beta hydrolase fold domain-containing protein n=1 Tax=Streptomyces sp. A1-5 TaxID=2738410 RepID=UPI001F28FA56
MAAQVAQELVLRGDDPGRAGRGADGGPNAGTIRYFHGGGWVFGSPESALSLTGYLAARTGLGAYSLNYRLAPEHPFPAAIEDTLSAYRALLDRGEDPSAIVFAGDSAGGGLVVTTCLAARDAGLPMSSSTSLPTCRTCSSRSPASSTRRTRHWTVPPSSCVSGSVPEAQCGCPSGRRVPVAGRLATGRRSGCHSGSFFTVTGTRLMRQKQSRGTD